ncbi:45 kDa calcium-binding protein isoform X1 [Vidua chalybeata]|uniref:45 kDa calcium-binding protein isoform X1 n=1 Tax=Vidua chalybeata TaxID=81927 RepID=UPI0023A7EACD|nr:45 kDa calcium-binding protein isoform X1 [Vidua chalybeata]
MPGPAGPCSRGSLCLWLLLLLLLAPPARARPANHSLLREKGGEGRDEKELVPPDHLNGVKMELDGHLNREFHQEVFLGKELERFEEDSQPRRNRRKLVGIFAKVDVNNDKKISAKEMQRWIMEKTDEHFQEAVEENKMHFRAVDPDGDGHVSWDEYKIKFLASKGFNEKEIAEKIKNNEELKIDEETQEVLDNLKDRWYQADNPPPDLLLSEQEFLSFLHPEHSRGMLHFMVQEIIRDLGRGQEADAAGVHLAARGHRGEPAGPGHRRRLGEGQEEGVPGGHRRQPRRHRHHGGAGGIHGSHERAQRAERGAADDRRGRREPEPPPGAGRDPQVQRVFHRQQTHGLRPQRPRGILSSLPSSRTFCSAPNPPRKK